MKNWRQNHDLNFNDMTGDSVTIIGDLNAGKKGKAKWNGAIMKARLVEGATALKDGAEAEIVEVKEQLESPVVTINNVQKKKIVDKNNLRIH